MGSRKQAKATSPTIIRLGRTPPGEEQEPGDYLSYESKDFRLYAQAPTQAALISGLVTAASEFAEAQLKRKK